MMTCKEFADRVSDYLDGRVPYGERIGIWIHALMCEPCRRYLEQMRQTVNYMGEVGKAEREQGCPEETKADLLDQYRDRCCDEDD